MKLSRRELLKTLAGAGAALVSSSGALLPGPAGQAHAAEESAEEWKKSPCRFCGVGCGVLVGLRQGKVVAVRGDAEVPVNRGLLCIKGYSLPKVLYGSDRYKVPLLRQGHKFVQISWNQALDIMASKFKGAIQQYGPESVAAYFSGQTTVFEGYAINKLMKAGIGSNNLEGNPRLCMASAVAGFYSTFGMDEPMGCYDDIELTDTFFIWGSNLAEMHPILYSRMVERKHQDSNVKIVSLQTYLNRSSETPSDIIAIFKPHSDLALANAMAHVIVKEGLINETFIQQHVSFKKGLTGIGYGVEDNFEYGGGRKPVGKRTNRLPTSLNRSVSRSTKHSWTPTHRNMLKNSPASQPTRSVRLLASWAIPNGRPCPAGRWALTSTYAAPGSTTWSITSTC